MRFIDARRVFVVCIVLMSLGVFLASCLQQRPHVAAALPRFRPTCEAVDHYLQSTALVTAGDRHFSQGDMAGAEALYERGAERLGFAYLAPTTARTADDTDPRWSRAQWDAKRGAWRAAAQGTRKVLMQRLRLFEAAYGRPRAPCPAPGAQSQ